MAEKIARGIRIVGEQRDALGAQLVERYEAGESIRSIAKDIGRSYGFVHGVLAQSNTSLRGRGGATRGASRV